MPPVSAACFCGTPFDTGTVYRGQHVTRECTLNPPPIEKPTIGQMSRCPKAPRRQSSHLETSLTSLGIEEEDTEGEKEEDADENDGNGNGGNDNGNETTIVALAIEIMKLAIYICTCCEPPSADSSSWPCTRRQAPVNGIASRSNRALGFDLFESSFDTAEEGVQRTRVRDYRRRRSPSVHAKQPSNGGKFRPTFRPQETSKHTVTKRALRLQAGV
ncbi:hypothetical protein CHU98_g10456 [Xylaria longipes]|nr:hypothetical protein CHU98_g10456 [Xylaria longipes]